jgi:hypothetical protein
VTRLCLALLLALLGAAPASAERLVIALSSDIVRIASNFAGDSITLFGVIERAGAVSRTGPYEVAVIVKGPPQTVLVQERQRVLGVWVNAPGERFEGIPSYYGVLTSAGAHTLVTDDSPGADPSLRWMPGGHERATLRQAIADRQRATGLFVEDFDAVTMLTDMFFRTEIPLPSIVADGVYRITILLYADGVALDTAEAHFVIAKVGFEQRLFELSRDEPLLYGLAAVVLALVTGYVGGVVFRRG